MFSIIIDQLRFKKLPMVEYNKVSSLGMWSLFALIAVSVGYMPESSVEFWILNTIMSAVSVFLGYKFLGFLLKKRELWDGTGNLFGLFVTSSAIDVLAVPSFLVHPALGMILFILSLFVGVNAFKGALDIKLSRIIVVFVMTFVVVMVLGIIVGFAGGFLAETLGIELPPIPEMVG
jgi:hypothetical protein